MAFHSVHQFGGGDKAVAGAAFVREAFSWKAFFLGPLWLRRHRLWAALLVWTIAYLVLIAASRTVVSADTAFVIAVSLQILLGLEANHLREVKLAARGYRLVEIIAAPAREAAEIAFFAASLRKTPRPNPWPGRKAAPEREVWPVNVAIVDYGSGNLHSAHKAFERAAREAGLAANHPVTRDPDMISRADRIVLPGVGAFADCRAGLDAVPGMVAAMTASRA